MPMIGPRLEDGDQSESSSSAIETAWRMKTTPQPPRQHGWSVAIRRQSQGTPTRRRPMLHEQRRTPPRIASTGAAPPRTAQGRLLPATSISRSIHMLRRGVDSARHTSRTIVTITLVSFEWSGRRNGARPSPPSRQQRTRGPIGRAASAIERNGTLTILPSTKSSLRRSRRPASPRTICDSSRELSREATSIASARRFLDVKYCRLDVDQAFGDQDGALEQHMNFTDVPTRSARCG